MGLCCSCLEDNTRPSRGGESPPPFVHVQQPRPQQRQQQMANGHNLLIEPRVAVRVAPRPREQLLVILEMQQCIACGQDGHTRETCRYRERLCFYCREEGHIIAVCPARRRQRQRREQRRPVQRRQRRQAALRF